MLKERMYVIVFGLMILLMVVALIAVPKLNSPTGYAVIEESDFSKEINQSAPDFKIYTIAVCKNVSGYVSCRDELFASCNGLEYMIPREVNGTGEFGEDWKDPRNS